MGFIFGRFIKRKSDDPRISINDMRVADLLLLASDSTIIHEYNGELYYKIIHENHLLLPT